MHDMDSKSGLPVPKHFNSKARNENAALIGRTVEQDKFQLIIKDALTQEKQLLMLHGEPGSGKTLFFMHETEKLSCSNRIVCKTKYQQYSGDDPYTSLSELMRPILDHILVQPEQILNSIKKILQNELRENSSLINDILPGFDLACDCSLIPTVLPVRESEKRLILALQKFFDIAASRVDLVVLFLDDIQWANSGSLSLILEVFSGVSSSNFLAVAAYRTSEINEDALDMLKEIQCKQHDMEMMPLTDKDIELLISTKFREISDKINGPEKKHLREVTKGNPLFLSRLLEYLITAEMRGEGSQARVSKRNRELKNIIGSNSSLLDLLKSQISYLSADEKNMLGASACLGRYITAQKLIELGYKHTDVQANLEIFRKNGFLIENSQDPTTSNSGSNKYSFIHDKIQQAATQILSENALQEIHLENGKSLLYETAEITDDVFPFEKLDSLNKSIELVKENAQRLILARLNFKAARLARIKSANEAAISYLNKVKILLKESWWIDEQDLLVETFYLLSELLLGRGRVEESEKVLRQVLPLHRNDREHGKFLTLLIGIKSSQSDYESAIEYGRSALAIWNIALPSIGVEAEVEKEFSISRILCTEARLVKLTSASGETENEELRVKMNLLINLLPPTDAIDPDLNRWVSIKMVNLTMTEGFTPESAKALVNYGVTVCLQEETAWGNKLGKQAVKLQELSRASLLGHRVRFTYLTYLKHWKEPLQEVLNDIESISEEALKFGDELYAGFSLGMTGSLSRLYIDQPLSKTEQELAAALKFCKKTGNVSSELLCVSTLIAINYLRSEDVDNTQFIYDGLDESDLVRRCESEGSLMPVCILRILQAYSFVLDGKIDSASYAIEAAIKSIDSLYSTMPSAICIFLRGYIASRKIQDELHPNAKQFEILNSCRHIIDGYAEDCPHNFLHLAKILQAEQQLLTGDSNSALVSYQEAVDSSIKSGFSMYGALAHERLAEIWNSRNNQYYRKAHIGHAALLYGKWGALRKVEMLKNTCDWSYSNAQSLIISWKPEKETTDLKALAFVADSIASELDYENLLNQLLSAVSDYSNANFTAFMMESDSDICIEAILENDSVTTSRISIVDDEFQKYLPVKVINYVSRLKKSFSITSPLDHSEFSTESSIEMRAPNLITCIPVTVQDELVGLVYFEHSHHYMPLTDYMLEVLKVMSTQAINSLRNINLRLEMETEIKLRTDELAKLNVILQTKVEKQFDEINQLNLLKQFMSPQVAEIVVSRDNRTLLTSHRRQISVVFCDLRGFTAYSERVEPEEEDSFLKKYHETLGRLITKYNATFDHRAGDGIMVFLGDPIPQENRVYNAVQMADEMRRDVGILLSDVYKGALNLGFGIGVSYGFATIGMVGYSGGYGYSARGRYVNLASRLCDNAKDGELLISKSVYTELDESDIEGSGSDICIQGFSQSVSVFNVTKCIKTAASTLI